MQIESNLSLGTIISYKIPEGTHGEVAKFFKEHPKRRICRYGFGNDELVVRFTKRNL